MDFPAATLKVYLAICVARGESPNELPPKLSDLPDTTRLSESAIYAAKRRLLADGLLTIAASSAEIPDQSCPENEDVDEDSDDGFENPFSPIEPSSVSGPATVADVASCCSAGDFLVSVLRSPEISEAGLHPDPRPSTSIGGVVTNELTVEALLGLISRLYRSITDIAPVLEVANGEMSKLHAVLQQLYAAGGVASEMPEELFLCALQMYLKDGFRTAIPSRR